MAGNMVELNMAGDVARYLYLLFVTFKSFLFYSYHCCSMNEVFAAVHWWLLLATIWPPLTMSFMDVNVFGGMDNTSALNRKEFNSML